MKDERGGWKRVSCPCRVTWASSSVHRTTQLRVIQSSPLCSEARTCAHTRRLLHTCACATSYAKAQDREQWLRSTQDHPDFSTPSPISWETAQPLTIRESRSPSNRSFRLCRHLTGKTCLKQQPFPAPQQPTRQKNAIEGRKAHAH